jgi:hypothetical protein
MKRYAVNSKTVDLGNCHVTRADICGKPTDFVDRQDFREFMAAMFRETRHTPEIKAIVHRGRLARKQARELASRPPRALSPIERMIDQATGFQPASK